MKEYIIRILRSLLQIVLKNRKRNSSKSKSTKIDFEAAKNEMETTKISNEPIPNLHESAKTTEVNNISDIVLDQIRIEEDKNLNNLIIKDLVHQTKNDNDVQIEPIISELEINNIIVDTEEDIKESDKTSLKEQSAKKIRVNEIKPQENSNNIQVNDKQQLTETHINRITTSIELNNEIDELLQKIDSVFNEHKLLGNYDFSEDEYSELLETVGLLCNSLINYGNVFDDKHYKLIFTTLVEISKRWKDSGNEDDTEENSRFWDYIFKHLINEDYVNQKLYFAFTDVISQLGEKKQIPIVLTGKKYYSTLMMHSFAPKDSIFSFYDLCYNIFKKDLNFGFTNEDEWLCEKIASQIRTVLSGGYREDKKVSIGSSAYSIKIGFRSFSVNEDLSADFVQFIKDTFYQINKLFNREFIDAKTRLERYIVEWWKNKKESEKVSDDTMLKRRVPTVSKDNITAKYIREEKSVLLYIPSIRLDDWNSIVSLEVFVNAEQIYSQEIRTKRGEFVVATKQIELELNDLLRHFDTINLRVEIKENHTVIFDSEKTKATSLNREFILFEGEKEVLSQINKPTNYFVYSKDIDGLRRKPEELTTYGPNLYNIYPKAGERLLGEIKQVFFVDKTKTASIGKAACLIGGELNVEWFFNDISCVVYSSGVKLLVPEDTNLKALELRINSKAHKLNELIFERIESGCYQFGLIAIGLILENHPTEINLYSYEKESIILSETIIVLPNLEIQFNHQFYYGDLERKLIIKNGDKSLELTWSNQDSEIRCPINDGILLIKIPYLRWRINDKEWHNDHISKKLWYKDVLENGDILEIDNPKESDDIKIYGKTNGKSFEIIKNKNENFEIGRGIYANESLTEITVCMVLGKYNFEIFTVSTKEHFITNPLSYIDGKVFWNVEDSFVGEKSNEFLLIIESRDNDFRSKINLKNCEIKNLHDDICKIQVRIQNKNIFSNTESYQLIYKGELLIGTPEKLRFKYKNITLLSANCFESKKYEWIPFIPKYFIDKLKFVQEDENNYYTGQLCVIDNNGERREIRTMINEKGVYDKTNPVRIELRDNSTLWLVAGWEGGNDFIGNLFCDKRRRGICNIQRQDNYYGEINLYKFKEEDNV